jgi:hypothetical protein
MLKWEKACQTIHSNGESELLYVAEGTELKIESRKRAIPHANRSGSWMHTTYFLIRPDGTEKEYWTLKKAKEAAENAE